MKKQWSLRVIYIKIDGTRKLVKVGGNLDSAKYIKMLKDNLIPGLYETDFLVWWSFSHRLHAAQQSFIDKGVTMLKDKPAQSPDLNIID